MSEWTLDDDLKLVEAVEELGFGNWTEIGRLLNRSVEDVEDRCTSRFLANGPEFPQNDQLCPNRCALRVKQKPTPLNWAYFTQTEAFLRELHRDELKALGADPPPKHSFPPKQGKVVFGPILTAGYCPLRSDFDVEYDDKAESIVAAVVDQNPDGSGDSDTELENELKCAVVSIYNQRLHERLRRKRVVRAHGLIDSRKTYSMLQRLEVPFGRRQLSVLLPFLRFFSGPEFDYLIEKLMYQKELSLRISSLINYRTQGIRFLSGIKIYESLNKKHLKYTSDLVYNNVDVSSSIVGEMRSSRKPSAPLVLHNLPGYNLLDEAEKQLCSTARIVPETYHNFKKALIAECTRNNGLRLAQARHLIKIDVNKTRKMYDHLLSTGLIWQPKNT